MAGNGKGAAIWVAISWPWYVGTYLAVQAGAANPSLARTITGWVFEAPWLAFLGAFIFYRSAVRSAARKRALVQAAEQERIAKARATTTTVRCPNCQHVQAVPRSQPAFVCEGCKAHLKRRTQPDTANTLTSQS